MTTLVVARKNGVACIGADSLARLGSTRESAEYIVNHGKLVRVDDSWLAWTGHASFQLVAGSYFSAPDVPRDFSSPATIFETFRAFHGALKERYFLNPKEDEEDPFESTQMDCLVANRHGIFGVYSLRSVHEYSRFYAVGSGYGYALGAMHAVFDASPDAETVGRAGLAAAATFDDGTAAPLELRTVRLS